MSWHSSLNHYVVPWGRIYFVSEGGLLEDFFFPSFRHTKLTEYIDLQVQSRQQAMAESMNPKTETSFSKNLLLCCLFSCLGAAVVLYNFLKYNRIFPIYNQSLENQFGWLARARIMWGLMEKTLLYWPWSLLFGCLLVAMIGWSKCSRKSWVIAFVLGIFVARLCIYWLS